MVNKDLNRLREVLESDELSFQEIKRMCSTLYKMNNNPLPAIRSYLKKYSLDIPIHYMESNRLLEHSEIFSRVFGRHVPLLVLNARKDEGMVRAVHMYEYDGRTINMII